MGMAEVTSAAQHTYERHKPEETILYKIVQKNWLPFREQVERDTGYPLPDFVIKEFEEFLRLAGSWLMASSESNASPANSNTWWHSVASAGDFAQAVAEGA